ncbi:unnamed protein product [Caenorhabditis auriculariae]|uniref:Uncharacterized protein n=1 Tax=Caenorhabditis auriculariae TaxID=2777116 RepID=A0A8S1HNK1_9PELO|nr:unnamed protein product [Caenorhabditis auriculariae]
MLTSVKILTFLAFCVVAGEAISRISVKVDGKYTVSHYDEEALNERRRESIRALKQAGVSQFALDSLEGFGRRFQDLYKENPNLTEAEYFAKFGESYFGDLFELVGHFPPKDRLKIGRAFGKHRIRLAQESTNTRSKPAGR